MAIQNISISRLQQLMDRAKIGWWKADFHDKKSDPVLVYIGNLHEFIVPTTEHTFKDLPSHFSHPAVKDRLSQLPSHIGPRITRKAEATLFFTIIPPVWHQDS